MLQTTLRQFTLTSRRQPRRKSTAKPIEKLTTWPILDRTKILKSVRYWDKAGTESDDAAFTAGARLHMLKDNRFVIEHVVILGANGRHLIVRKKSSSGRSETLLILDQEPTR